MVAEPVDPSEIEDAFALIGRFIGELFIRITNAIERAFEELADNISELFGRVIGALELIVKQITEVVGDIFGQIEEFIQTTISEILKFVDGILTDIVIGIQELIRDTTAFMQTLTKDIVAFFDVLLKDGAQLLSDIFDEVYQSITSIVDQVTTLFSDIFDVVATNIQLLVDEVILFIGDLFTLVSSGVNTILATGQEVVASLERGITEFIDEVVNTVGGTLRDLLDTISNLPAEISALANRLSDALEESIKNPLVGLPIALFTALADAISGDVLDDADNSFMAGLSLLFGTSPVARSKEQFRQLVIASTPSHPVLKAIVTTVLYPLMLMPMLMGMANANAQIILQEHALENPYRIIEPPDLIRSKHFDLLSQADTISDLRKHGYTETDAQILLQIGETIAPEAEQIIWWLRGISSSEAFETALHSLGWTSESIEKLKLSAFFIPPVQDLISMAVREVFTPEIAERFGQFEDLPPEFVENAAKQGVSEEWANNYWAAHWALPSVQMGFEMLHRRVITPADMDLLLRSADVMPFWRDKIVAISFNPLTRVDIRRMHKLDVLTEAEVFNAYQDIGYNPANAQRLLDFTIALNKPAQAQDDADLSALTRTNIINFYADGVLPRRDAEDLLIQIGLSRDAAELFLDATDMDLQRKERKSEIGIILDQADTGTLSFEEAQDKLNRMGLETAEIELALAELTKREAKRNKLPSRADLDKMLGAELIDEEVYMDTLRKLGFSTFWADKYLGLIGGK